MSQYCYLKPKLFQSALNPPNSLGLYYSSMFSPFPPVNEPSYLSVFHNLNVSNPPSCIHKSQNVFKRTKLFITIRYLIKIINISLFFSLSVREQIIQSTDDGQVGQVSSEDGQPLQAGVTQGEQLMNTIDLIINHILLILTNCKAFQNRIHLRRKIILGIMKRMMLLC